TKDNNRTTFSPGNTLTYTIVVKNENGPSDVIGAKVVDNAPSNTTIVSWSATTSGGASVVHSNGTGDLNETVDIPVGGQITYTVQLKVHSDYGMGDISNTAKVTPPSGVTDPITKNNTATDKDTNESEADLSVTK